MDPTKSMDPTKFCKFCVRLPFLDDRTKCGGTNCVIYQFFDQRDFDFEIIVQNCDDIKTLSNLIQTCAAGGYDLLSTVLEDKIKVVRKSVALKAELDQVKRTLVSKDEDLRRHHENWSRYIEAKRAYFNEHKDEQWLKDKYHPTNLLSVIKRGDTLAGLSSKDFINDFQQGTLDIGPGVLPASAYKSHLPREPNDEGSSEETDLLSAAPKAHQLSSEPRRVKFDIKQAQALAKKLDSEKGIVGNPLYRSDNDLGSRDESHGSSDNDLGSKAVGLRHVMRGEGKGSDAPGSGAEWEMKLDSYWHERLNRKDSSEAMAAKEKVAAAADAVAAALKPYVIIIKGNEKQECRYGCGVKGCIKLFVAEEALHKHLKLKHSELVDATTSEVHEDLYIENFMNDENAPGSRGTSFKKNLPFTKSEMLDLVAGMRRHLGKFDEILYLFNFHFSRTEKDLQDNWTSLVSSALLPQESRSGASKLLNDETLKLILDLATNSDKTNAESKIKGKAKVVEEEGEEED